VWSIEREDAFGFREEQREGRGVRVLCGVESGKGRE